MKHYTRHSAATVPPVDYAVWLQTLPGTLRCEETSCNFVNAAMRGTNIKFLQYAGPAEAEHTQVPKLSPCVSKADLLGGRLDYQALLRRRLLAMNARVC